MSAKITITDQAWKQIVSQARARRGFGLQKEEAKVFLDRKSLVYLKGAEIDYVEGSVGSGFVTRNPPVEGACGYVYFVYSSSNDIGAPGLPNVW